MKNALTHIKEEEKGFISANSFWLQSTGAGSRGGSKVEQPVTARPRAERVGRRVGLVLSQHLNSHTGQGLTPGNGATPVGEAFPY